MILDYSCFVEFVENDHCGIYQDQPTARDFRRNVRRIGQGLSGKSGDYVDSLHRHIDAFIRQRRAAEAAARRRDGNCPHCRGLLRYSREIMKASGRDHELWRCTRCGWWQSYEYIPPDVGGTDFERSFCIERISILREFQIGDIDIPISTLRTYLDRNPSALYDVHPTSFERLVADVFADFLSCDVVHVGKTADGGIDAVVLNGDDQRVIQVKRRLSGRGVESVREVREFVGAMVLNQYQQGIFVTTSNHFSKPAMNAAETAVERGVVETLELVNCGKLVDILSLTRRRNRAPWQESALPRDFSIDQAFLMRPEMRRLFSCVEDVKNEAYDEAWEENVIDHYINEK